MDIDQLTKSLEDAKEVELENVDIVIDTFEIAG